jgi:Kinesin motor domain
MRSRSSSRIGSGGYITDDGSISNSSTGLSRQESLISSQKLRGSETHSDGTRDMKQRAKSPNRSAWTSTQNGVSNSMPNNSSIRSSIKLSGQQLSSQIYRPGRVRVGIRCRPAFQDEIDFAQGDFFSIVECYDSTKNSSRGYRDDAAGVSLDRVSLTLLSGKQRDFAFDYGFDSSTTQDEVYDRIARPVVVDVLQGFNGTIFCYGQVQHVICELYSADMCVIY